MNKKLKIGMVCPYGWDTPGGVQIHMKELAEYFQSEGHEVSLLAPVSDESSIVEDWLFQQAGLYQFHLTEQWQEFSLVR